MNLVAGRAVATTSGNIRVMGKIDDGGLRALIPSCRDFIMAPSEARSRQSDRLRPARAEKQIRTQVSNSIDFMKQS